MLDRARVAVLYSIFAATAMAANVGTQALVTSFYNGRFAIELSVVVGTVVGLPVKYLLDKRYIFGYQTAGALNNARVAALYSLMAVLTTLLFWATEWLFHFLFNDAIWRLVGASLGLTAGYLIKYQLDRKFVFVTRPDSEESS